MERKNKDRNQKDSHELNQIFTNTSIFIKRFNKIKKLKTVYTKV